MKGFFVAKGFSVAKVFFIPSTEFSSELRLSSLPAILISFLIASSFLFLGGELAAGESASQKQSAQLTQWTAARLNRANEYLAEENYAAAKELLEKLIQSQKDKSSFEAAMSYQAYAYVFALHSEKGGSKSYAQAINYFEKSLPGLKAAHRQLQKTRLDLAQLYIAELRFKEAISILKRFLSDAKQPSAQANILIGNAYAQLEKFAQAIPYVERALATSDGPPEAWQRLLLSLYLSEQAFQPAVALLTTMLTQSPKRHEYWKQLGSIQVHLKDYKQGAASLEMARKHGLLTEESQLIRLSNLLLLNKTPQKAALLLQESLDQNKISATEMNWNRLADAALMARDKSLAITALQQAAVLSKEGSKHFRLAQIHINQENWPAAQTQLNFALEKGQLKKPGEAHLLLGMVLSELKQQQAAVAAFKRAQTFPGSEASARQWLEFLCEQNSETAC